MWNPKRRRELVDEKTWRTFAGVTAADMNPGWEEGAARLAAHGGYSIGSARECLIWSFMAWSNLDRLERKGHRGPGRERLRP
jgi:hypothetical protein